MFWAVIAVSIIGIYIYARVDTFAFYTEWHTISVQLFGKGLDSGRPWLWGESLNAIGNNWVVGMGTGIQTNDLMNFEGSFHNQFIQLFMQNGLIGLFVFYGILFTLWKPLARHLDDRIVRICLAAFIGIIAYNCFETTLLENKVALGIMQWQLIAIGVSRACSLDKLLKSQSQTKYEELKI